ncbi:acid phosphatase [Solimonas marina]|uniref:Acid phosphatase n=1 Tax=Solimonas marina TaxID=2714601 RepID=A0A969W771_9GAMM|nr:phosphatase PAP2 family protein [Solimonas marina]NKF20794.1 phosphatase PAP2 family protein [Solimonas marina]
MSVRARTLAAAICLISGVAAAGSPAWETPEASDRKAFAPYIDKVGLKFLVLAGPPAEGSPPDLDDVRGILRRQQTTSAARWAQAEADGDALYAQFSAAFGRPIDRVHAPYTVRLLNRLEKTVAIPTFAAKKVYHRARPYQRLPLERVCGRSSAPTADPDVAKRTSYPSGHSAYGWMAAQVLAALAPNRAQQILQRGMDYGESRLVCGVHFPSDVAAGRLIATAVYERVRRVEAFRRDFACAAAELDTPQSVADRALLAQCGPPPPVEPADGKP